MTEIGISVPGATLAQTEHPKIYAEEEEPPSIDVLAKTFEAAAVTPRLH